MTASGRKLPLKTLVFQQSERPLLGKADIQIRIFEKTLRNDRYTPDSGP
jgi:hypothetical protein